MAVDARAGDSEALLVGGLDYAAVRDVRYRLSAVRDSNLSLISREFRRLEQILGVPDMVREP